jgi:hypothetical protein
MGPSHPNDVAEDLALPSIVPPNNAERGYAGNQLGFLASHASMEDDWDTLARIFDFDGAADRMT